VLTIAQIEVSRGWEEKLLGDKDGPAENALDLAVPFAPEYTLSDDYSALYAGDLFSITALLPELSALDLRTLGRRFALPVFFFEGRHDAYTVPGLVAAYAAGINAPLTKVVWFEKSGHFPFVEEPEAFLNALVRDVRPLAFETRQTTSERS
jgi:pimeloyl-ACP methyl ester carboxylesterase